MPCPSTEEKVPVVDEEKLSVEDTNAEFSGTETRKALEKRLLLKLDLRMSIMIMIYILNYVTSPSSWLCHFLFLPDRQKQCQV